MDRAYLFLNAALYVLFALWCAVSPDKTASAVGFTFRSGSGKSEFIAVYGGMELGFAVFFALTALSPALRPAGILFSLCFYGGIVLFRLYSFTTVTGIERPTYILASLEAILLIAAIILKLRAT